MQHHKSSSIIPFIDLSHRRDVASSRNKALRGGTSRFHKKRNFFALFENNLNTLRVCVFKQTQTPGSIPSVSLGASTSMYCTTFSKQPPMRMGSTHPNQKYSYGLRSLLMHLRAPCATPLYSGQVV